MFEAALGFDMRIVTGKVLMDRNAPGNLRDTAESGYLESKSLIEKWHGRSRLGYAVTPRFAYTSSDAQLEAAGALMKEHDGVLLHTHLAENKNEINLVRSTFPERKSYLDVYDHYGLTGSRSVFAHGIHLTDSEMGLLGKTRSAVSHCPMSNLFLGSGLFDMGAMKNHSVPVSLGTDIGAGTSFSMLKNMAESYKVCQLKGHSLSPLHAFYLATLGGARALGLDQFIGNFDPGKEADFIIIDPSKLPILMHRLNTAESLEEKLFAIMILGDDRIIESAYVSGQRIAPEAFP
jgi:guanine deaminase